MTQGNTPKTRGLFNLGRDYCERVLPERSIYRLLHEHGDALFPDVFFADLYSKRGRHSVPPRILATVMVLQRLGGLSDREAADRFAFDVRWQYAAGGLEADYGGFRHTVLVNMRARLRNSESPTRIFEAVVSVAKEAGLVGARRVLDSTPLYDAVATQDTVTLIRSAIRSVLRVCSEITAAEVRKVLARDETYESPGKPTCAWDDVEARTELVDALARDGYAVLSYFEGRRPTDAVQTALELLATVLGQDLEQDAEGAFRIARRVAKDRVISTVDPETRHGHKSSAHGFDGYKGHIAIDPDTEIITASAVTAGNVADGEPVKKLIAEMLPPKPASETVRKSASKPATPAPRAADLPEAGQATDKSTSVCPEEHQVTCESGSADTPTAPSRYLSTTRALRDISGRVRQFLVMVGVLVGLVDAPRPNPALVTAAKQPDPDAVQPGARVSNFRRPPAVYGDCAYGTAKILSMLDAWGIEAMTRVQHPASRGGCFAQDKFAIDRVAATAVCRAGQTADIRPRRDGSGLVKFGDACQRCALREQCTSAKRGRTLNIHAMHEVLEAHRKQQQADGWQADYRATRPKVERKIGHLMRRRHGGRRARMRGTIRVEHDFSLLAAAVNLARLARLGVELQDDGWSVVPS